MRIVIATGIPSALSAPLTAAEVDLLLRTGSPPTEVVREIESRGLSEPLSTALKAKFTAGGVTNEVVLTAQMAHGVVAADVLLPQRASASYFIATNVPLSSTAARPSSSTVNTQPDSPFSLVGKFRFERC